MESELQYKNAITSYGFILLQKKQMTLIFY